MISGIRIALAFLITGMSLATPPVLGAEPDEDMRQAARMLVSLEGPLAVHDLKGYCAALYGSPNYARHLARSCQLSVDNKSMKAEDCPEVIRQETRRLTNRCLAMSDGEFDKEILEQRRGLQDLITITKGKGIDGEKLLQEERAKVR